MTVAVVLLAHDKPKLLRRLVRVLDGFPIFLHVDAGVPQQMHAELTSALPERVRLLPRISSGWATFGLLEAELAGYRAACSTTDAQHVVMMTGADYPLVNAEGLAERLGRARGRSWAQIRRLPIRHWGPMGGYDRFVFGNRVRDRKRVWSLIPRRWPKGIRPAGGSQLKILARHHAELILEIVDSRPDLVDYFRTTWIPDETMIPSLLTSPAFGARWETSHLPGAAWYIDWGKQPSPNPRWLDETDLPALRTARTREVWPALFARKFREDSTALLDRIEQDLWPLP
jgi:hypothetical protein